MSEFRPASDRPDVARRRVLREALPQLEPGWQPLAESVLGADGRIDWVGHDERGRVVLFIWDGDGDGSSLIPRGLAHQEWMQQRIADWAQLVPAARLQPAAGATCWGLARSFPPAVQAAARRVTSLGLRLAEARFLENGSGPGALLEALEAEPPAPRATPTEPESGFRTGLSAEDLGLSPEEYAEFEPRR